MAASADPAGSGGDAALLVLYVLLALVFSFLCSVAESVLLSITPSYIAGLKAGHPRRAALLKRLKQDDIDQSLAAILTLNTIAHTVGAIGAGAKATVVFGSAWFGLFSAVMTLLILFLSEIVPKTLGAVYWRSLAGATAIFVRALILVLYPLIWISERLTRLVARGKKVHAFNREEFIAMAGLGEKIGEIEKHESWIIHNLFRLRSLGAKDIMTPRTVIEGMQQDTSVSEVVKSRPVFSRLPVYGANIDEITGFVLKEEALQSVAEGRPDVPLTDLKREILVVPEATPLPALLERFLDSRTHVAVVLNEYGGTSGLVTLEDVVETLVGKEIVDELDTVEDMREMARRRWAKRARALRPNLDPSVLKQAVGTPVTEGESTPRGGPEAHST